MSAINGLRLEGMSVNHTEAQVSLDLARAMQVMGGLNSLF